MKIENFLDKMNSVADTDRWDKLLPYFKYYVKAQDPFLSGWGEAPKTSYVIVLCHDGYEVDAVVTGLEKANMKYITTGNIAGMKSFPRKAGCHYSLYYAPDTYWYRDNIHRYQSGINEPSKGTRYRATGLEGHKTRAPKCKKHGKKFGYLKNAYKKML